MTSRKAYCKQLNPHSFIQTNKSNQERKKNKGMVSDAEKAQGDFETPRLVLWDN